LKSCKLSEWVLVADLDEFINEISCKTITR